jgi:hypothetical protein
MSNSATTASRNPDLNKLAEEINRASQGIIETIVTEVLAIIKNERGNGAEAFQSKMSDKKIQLADEMTATFIEIVEPWTTQRT